MSWWEEARQGQIFPRVLASGGDDGQGVWGSWLTEVLPLGP